MHSLALEMAERIASGLKKKSLKKCSDWAIQCRVMGRPFPGPWSFKYHPWLREMHDSKAEFNVGRKGAQVGFTETVLNVSLFKIDVETIDCLYVLPAKTPDASDFSASRFDSALELSPYLAKLFSDVKNVGHKRAGSANLYIRGSKSRSALKSIPVGFIALDEVDEMEEENIPLATERTSGQVDRQIWALSTPTIGNFGIDKMFLETTQEHFFFKCPCCSRQTELIFPECLQITGESLDDPKLRDSQLICKECKGILHHESKPDFLADGKWIPSTTLYENRGFWIPQLYSSTVAGKPAELAKAFIRAQSNPADEQEFYNSKLGLPHIVEGARVTDQNLDECRKEYKNNFRSPKLDLVTMGIDVGKWLHFTIDEWKLPKSFTSTDINIQSKCRTLYYGKCLHFEELDPLMMKWSVNFAIIDANPERRKAYEFASRWPGYIKLCFYGKGIQGKQIHVGKDNEPTITVDRTSWLDLSLGRFRTPGMIELPLDINLEYRTHIKSLVRVYERDENGNQVGKYVKGNDDDHYAHSRNYSELALPFAASLGGHKNIGNVM